MKKLLPILSLILALCLGFTGCDFAPEEFLDDSREERSYEAEEEVTPQQEAPAPKPSIFYTKETSGPLHDGVVKYAGTTMVLTLGYDPNAESQPILVTSSNEAVMGIIGFYPDVPNKAFVRLEFRQAGTATLTFALESGESTTYQILVKEDYDFKPEKTYLTPGEFESCVRQVMQANGMSLMSSTTKHHGSTYLSDAELTWENARSIAETNSHSWYKDGYCSVFFTYRGTCPSGYKFTFYLPE